MSGGVLVLAEHADGRPDGVTFELLSLGRALADGLGQPLGIIVLGHGVEALAQGLTAKGADSILVADHPTLGQYNSEAACRVLADMHQEVKPSLYLLGYTYLGMELGPALATQLGLPMLSNCTAVELEGNSLVVTRPVFEATAYVRLRSNLQSPVVLSLQKGALAAKTLPPQDCKVVSVPVKLDEGNLRTRVSHVLRQVAWAVDLTKADVIVAAGRGIGSQSNLGLIKSLADALGGMVGCSRPLADMGWLPSDHVVGLSGRTVTPKVYLACGISGAAQHIAGMKDAKRIIAINKDPNAPIFRVAHYGIVEDLAVVLPMLLEEAKKGAPFVQAR